MAQTTLQQNVLVTQVFSDDAGYLYGVSVNAELASQGKIAIDSQDPVSRTIVFHRDDTTQVSY